MRIFMTGASGYIGQVVAEKAIQRGHQVVGLARSADAGARLERMGVAPCLGTLQSLELLAQAASAADGAIHLGLDQSGASSFSEIMDIDRAAVRALAQGLAGTGKGLVTSSGTGVAAADPHGAETDEASPLSSHPWLKLRAAAEADALSLAARGVRVAAVRLPPFVYGRSGSSFVPMLLKAALEHGVSPYVGEGIHLTSAVDVDEAAELYLLALERSPEGCAFNCTSEIDIPLRALAEAVGSVTGTPTRSWAHAEVEAIFGPFATTFLATSNRPSSARAREVLGWQPRPQMKLLDDITHGSYLDLVRRLKQEAAGQEPSRHPRPHP